MKKSRTSRIGVIVDKSKTPKSVKNTVSAFPPDSYILKRNSEKNRKYVAKSNNGFMIFLTALFH